MRLRTDFWISALQRRVEAAGAAIYVGRRGAAEAGAVFLVVDRLDGTFDVYAPAPQAAFSGSQPSDRLFSLVAEAAAAAEVERRIETELRFDSDLWLIYIEDRGRRPFAEVIEQHPFTPR